MPFKKEKEGQKESQKESQEEEKAVTNHLSLPNF